MHKQVALELSSYLDSEACRSLASVGREEQRRIVEAFVAACYEDLGKAPRLLDGHDVHEILGHVLPAHFGRKPAFSNRGPR